MRSQIIITVEHDETTDGVQMFTESIVRKSKSAKWSDIEVVDTDFKIDIATEDTEWRVNFQSFKEEYEYVVTAPSALSAEAKALELARADGYVSGGVTTTQRLS